MINFDEALHRYYDDKGRTYTSVTTFINELFPFDSKAIIEKCINNPRSKYYKMSPEKVQSLWDDTSEEGTKVHKAHEDYILQGIITDDPQIKPLINQFARLRFKGILQSEVRLWDEESLLAGTTDILEDLGDFMYVYDLKTSGTINDDKITKYSIQLNLYARFCQKIFKKRAIPCGIIHYENYMSLRENTKLKFVKYDPVIELLVDDALERRIKSISI